LERNTARYVISAVLNVTGLDDYTVWLSNFQRDGTDVPNIKITRELLKSFGLGKPESVGQAYSATKTKTLPTVLQAMFEDGANQMPEIGKPPFSVMKYLRGLRYVSGAASQGEANITGTHIFIPGDQENASTVRIIFKDSFAFGPEQKRQVVRITAQLSIDEGRQDILKGTYTYRVYVDFTGSQVQPQEALEYISMKKYRDVNFVAYSKDGAPKHERTDMTIPEYLETIFQDILKNKDDEQAGDARIKFTREGLATPYDSEDIPQDMRVKKLWSALAKDPPIKAHCVARAVQLLSVEAIQGQFKPQAFSSMCRLNFAYQKDGSLPIPGKPATEEFGLYSLATLFFEIGVPKLLESDKYREFLRFLRFSLEKTPALETTAPPAKMSELQEKAPAFCQGKEDAKVLLPPDLAGQLRGVVNDMLSQQRAHVNSVMNIMFMLFDRQSITGRKAFAFNRNILMGGMPEVARVNAAARDVLTKYYKDCEAKYQTGLRLIYQYDQKNPLSGQRPDGSIIPPRVASGPVATGPPPPAA